MAAKRPRTVIKMTKYTKIFTIGLSLLVGLAATAFAQNDSTFSLNAQLLVAARQSDVEGVYQSLARGALANSRNRLGKTALFMAIEKNQMEIEGIKYKTKQIKKSEVVDLRNRPKNNNTLF